MDAANKLSEKIRELNVESESDKQILDTIKEHIQNEAFDQAIKVISDALESDFSSPAVLYCQLGVINILRENYADAEKVLMQSVHIDENLAEAYYNLGLLYQNENEFEKATTFYKKVVLINPQDSQAYELLGECCQALDNVQDAIVFYDTALRIDPKSLNSAVNLAQLYLYYNNYTDAIEVLKIALVTHSDQKELHFALGDIYKTTKEYEHAIGHFRKVIMLDENNSRAYYELGYCCFELGLNNQSIPLLANAFKLDQHFSDPLYYLGKAYEKKKNIDSAVSAYEQWITMESENNEIKSKNFQEQFNTVCQYLVDYFNRSNNDNKVNHYKNLLLTSTDLDSLDDFVISNDD